MPEVVVMKITAGEPGAILTAAEHHPGDVLLLPRELIYSPEFVAQLEGFTAEDFLFVLATRGLGVGVIDPAEAQVNLYWPAQITPEIQMTWSQPKEYADAVIRSVQRAMTHPVRIIPTKLTA